MGKIYIKYELDFNNEGSLNGIFDLVQCKDVNDCWRQINESVDYELLTLEKEPESLQVREIGKSEKGILLVYEDNSKTLYTFIEVEI